MVGNKLSGEIQEHNTNTEQEMVASFIKQSLVLYVARKEGPELHKTDVKNFPDGFKQDLYELSSKLKDKALAKDPGNRTNILDMADALTFNVNSYIEKMDKTLEEGKADIIKKANEQAANSHNSTAGANYVMEEREQALTNAAQDKNNVYNKAVKEITNENTGWGWRKLAEVLKDVPGMGWASKLCKEKDEVNKQKKMEKIIGKDVVDALKNNKTQQASPTGKQPRLNNSSRSI